MLLTSLLLAAVLTTAPPDPVAGRASVIDGDTLEIHGQRIRLWGVDAPEGRQTCDRDGQSWRCGAESAQRLDDLIANRPVTCRAMDRDRYGRVVARCDVAGQDLGGWMVRHGWAVRYARYAGTAYVIEEWRARRDRAGLWSGTFVRPWDWRSGAR